MNKLQIFSNPEFGSIRTLDEDGKVLFAATDVAKALGYSNPHDAISKHCKGVAKREALTNGGVQELNFIPEGDVYRLITHSNLPDAEKFERWLFDDMLPTLRKTGSYSIVQADPNLPPELAMVEGLLNSMKQMYSTQQRHDKAIEQLTESMDTMKEVMTTDVNGDWRTACGHAIQAVARKLGAAKPMKKLGTRFTPKWSAMVSSFAAVWRIAKRAPLRRACPLLTSASSMRWISLRTARTKSSCLRLSTPPRSWLRHTVSVWTG